MSFYFIHTASGQEGPLSLEQLKTKNITKDTLVWREGLDQWAKAGTLTELKELFIVVPPPLPGRQPEKANSVHTPVPKKYKSLVLPAALVIILLAAAIFYFERKSKKTSTEQLALSNSAHTGQPDSLVKNDTTNKKDTSAKKDTMKMVNLDTLSNNMNWDTTSANKNKDSATSKADTSAGLPPYFITTKKKKEKKQPPKKVEKEKGKEKQNEANTQTETEKINPVSYLEVSGSFRKNIILETILEGTIYNHSNNTAFRDVVINVRFIDNRGHTIDTKQFTQPGLLRQGRSASFKFKTHTPYKAISARYSIAGAKIGG